jgi:3-oxoacyl-[acyl-carrier protein] reductase
VGLTGNFGVGNYAASKAGLLGLTKTLALELAPRNITANAVCPGFINTDILRSMPEDVLARITERIPLKRRGEVEDVAACILFLASESAGYVTGQSLGVNGGLYMGD